MKASTMVLIGSLVGNAVQLGIAIMNHSKADAPKCADVAATSESGAAMAVGAGAHDITQATYQVGHQTRHVTDEDRQRIRAALAMLPEGAIVGIAAPFGVDDAFSYGTEIYDFMRSAGWKSFNINNLTGSAVAHSTVVLPGPPSFSFQKLPDGTYDITIHQHL